MTFLAFLAVAALFLSAVSLLVIGGVVFALLLFFPLFVLALVGVLAGLDDRAVRQRNPSMNPRGW
jgi:membrane protein implicated in regulation of membrane protease activity